MALHAGEAVPDPTDDYLAPALNRLSRLIAAGSGGQILVSRSCSSWRAALCRWEPSFEIWVSIVYAICSTRSKYSSSFIPTSLPIFLPSGRSRCYPNNLFRQPTPLLGRERELGEIADLLRREDVHLVTLDRTGWGGQDAARAAGRG